MSFKTLWHQQQYNGESIVTAYQHICSHQIEKWRALTPVYCPSLGHLLSPSPSLFVLYIFKCFHCSLHPLLKGNVDMYVPVSLTHNMSTSTSSMRLQSFPSSHYIATMRWSFFLTIVAGGDNWATDWAFSISGSNCSHTVVLCHFPCFFAQLSLPATKRC